MYYYNPFTVAIMSRYAVHTELIDSQPIGFTGTASERPPSIFTTEVNADTLYFAAAVNFENPDVLIRVTSESPQYEWMTNNDPSPQDTPIGAVCGISTQALPVLPLVMPFFVLKDGRLRMQFTNSDTGQETGGVITWRLLKLTQPITDQKGTGWFYGQPW